jgi:hypothetical protein
MAIPQRFQDFTRNDLITVGTSSLVISDANPRSAIIIRNSSTGAQEITINLNYSSAVLNYGIVLKSGESFSDSDSAGYKCYQGVITAISSAINGQVSIFEKGA